MQVDACRYNIIDGGAFIATATHAKYTFRFVQRIYGHVNFRLAREPTWRYYAVFLIPADVDWSEGTTEVPMNMHS